MIKNSEYLPGKDNEIFNSIQALWSTKYVTEKAKEMRKKLQDIFKSQKLAAVPFGSLIASANDESDFDLLIHGLEKSVKQNFSGLGHVQYESVKIDRFDFPGEIMNAYDLKPQQMYKLNAYPNILLTPDFILGGDLELACKIRLAVVENMQQRQRYDLEWDIMIDDFLGYFLSPKFLSRSGLSFEVAVDLTQKLKDSLPTFLEYKALLERNGGKVMSS